MTLRDSSFDAAKGLGIYAVVLIHSINFLGWENPVLSHLIVSFYMPVFFFISGYFGYSKKRSASEIITKRFKELVVPYLTVGLVMKVLVNLIFNTGFLNNYLLDESKGGFWFLLVLFFFFFCYAVALKVSKGEDKVLFGIMLILYLLFFVGAFVAPKWAYDAFCLPSLRKFFPYFIGGMLVRKYSSHVSFWSVKNLVITGIIYALLLLIPIEKTIPGLIIWSVCAFFGCLFIINLFKSLPFECKLLSFFGQYSITIYIYHYIFMYILKSVTPPCFNMPQISST